MELAPFIYTLCPCFGASSKYIQLIMELAPLVKKILPDLENEYEGLMEKVKNDPCMKKCNCYVDAIKCDDGHRINTYTPKIISLLEKIIKDRTVIDTITIDENKPRKVNSKLTRSLRNEINDMHNKIVSNNTVLLSGSIFEYYQELKRRWEQEVTPELKP